MNHDVVIAGAGLVGGTLACLLGARGLRVALVEARPVDDAPLPARFNLRVSALGRAAGRVLEAAGVWSHLPADRLGPYRQMRVWDASGSGSVHFDSADIGEPNLGWIVENACVLRAIDRRLGELEGVRVYRPANLTALDVESTDAVVRLRDTRLRTRLVVGADGTGSWVRDAAGIRIAEVDYGQRAVVATVAVSRGHEETAWQRFLPGGPLAFLPLPGAMCSIVWSTDPASAQALVDMPPAHFAWRLEEAFEARLGQVTLHGPRASFPVRRVEAAAYVRPRIALVGDAAHTIHPLAGQGANLGLLDAAALAQVVLAARDRGRDLGRTANLRPYERWRRGHNLAVGRAMSAFHRLFGSAQRPVIGVRNVGLSLTDRMAPVKNAIMRAASGLEGDLPAFARADAAILFNSRGPSPR